MTILITGAAGFVGSRLAELFAAHLPGVKLVGIDNLSRRGSETNIPALQRVGCQFVHGDVRSADDVNGLPSADWLIDCAANPSVLAGLDGGSAQLVGHNLIGTLNLLEKCRRDKCGFIMLSTSRVYSVTALQQLPLIETETRFEIDGNATMPTGFSPSGVSENFPTSAPVSLYGATKLASEIMALEYAMAFDFPIWLNRCGVIAGAGQFGKIDQGIFSFWIYQWMLRRPLSYIGFNGMGKQVRDFFSPFDLARLLLKQMASPNHNAPKILNVGGGRESSMSLQEVSTYCRSQFGEHRVASSPESRAFDMPLYITDISEAQSAWDWQPEVNPINLLDDIVTWAVENRERISTGF